MSADEPKSPLASGRLPRLFGEIALVRGNFAEKADQPRHDDNGLGCDHHMLCVDGVPVGRIVYELPLDDLQKIMADYQALTKRWQSRA